MEPLATLIYYKVHREIDLFYEQKIIEEERRMHLYVNKITTHYRQFPIENIHDITFRPLGNEGGLVYLHTNHGVYSYNVKTSPSSFIHVCKRIIST